MSSSSPSTAAAGGSGTPSAAPTTREKLFAHLAFGAESGKTHRKVTIVGAGAVGLAAAYAILNQGLASELALVDVSPPAAKFTRDSRV